MVIVATISSSGRMDDAYLVIDMIFFFTSVQVRAVKKLESKAR